MLDIRSYWEKKSGWWIEERATVACAVCGNGQLIKFRTIDIEKVMDIKYVQAIRKGEKVWYFNATKDRECAEQEDEYVYANPSVLLAHFFKREG